MYKCNFCGKEYKSGKSVASHSKWCKKGPHRSNNTGQNGKSDHLTKSLIEKKDSYCKFCNKLYTSMASRNGHMVHCELNPNKLKVSRVGRPHTQETKDKLSRIRKIYLSNNPDAKYHHFGPSKPEIHLLNLMKNLGYNVIDQYSDPKWGRGFKIDIYLPDYKIGLEVNGNFKYNIDGKLKTYYQNRSSIIESHGIKIININYSKVYSMDKDSIDSLLKSTI